jgi:hypothetical protein
MPVRLRHSSCSPYWNPFLLSPWYGAFLTLI